jgi:hypothetical protein
MVFRMDVWSSVWGFAGITRDRTYGRPFQLEKVITSPIVPLAVSENNGPVTRVTRYHLLSDAI